MGKQAKSVASETIPSCKPGNKLRVSFNIVTPRISPQAIFEICSSFNLKQARHAVDWRYLALTALQNQQLQFKSAFDMPITRHRLFAC